jgi:hypothetical protein
MLMLVFGFQCHVDLQVDTYVSEEHTTYIFWANFNPLKHSGTYMYYML